PASFLLDLFGRRAAFALGASLGLAGGILAFWAVLNTAFVPFMIAMLWLGMAQGFGLFYRHAGAVSAQGASGRIFGAGLLSALIAPLLSDALAQVAGFDTQALILLAAGFVYLLALALSVMLPVRERDMPRSAAQGPTKPVFVFASLTAALAWALMSAVMAHAPLAMAGCGIGLGSSVLLMALHLMAMYAPGFVIGRLIASWGGGLVGLAGVGLLVLAACLLPRMDQALSMALVMMGAGTGWGLATIGAGLVAGFDLVAEEIGLDQCIEGADLVITGEGFLDEESFDGKVVGGVAALAAELGVPCVAVVGEVVDPLPELPEGLRVLSLTDRFGEQRAMADPCGCAAELVLDEVAGI
ncbi:MAG: hypothetical protein EBX39_05665, partial [Actinobacteria bacterium]|nr:hypothetical protein [Actinomycetota bacterium]